jgi:hypothetical protein
VAHAAAFRGYLLTLCPGEPAGRISTRNAGAISLRVTLRGRPGEEMPSGPILGDPSPGARFYSLIRTEDPASATRQISCQIRALYDEQLAAAVDSTLRAVTAHAAFTETILQTCALRFADPSETPVTLLEELARTLSGAGLRVTFGPSWTPTPDAQASVGTRGFEETLETFLQGHPTWIPSHRR